MHPPPAISRQSETEQILRNCERRLQQLLEPEHPQVFQRAIENANLSLGQAPMGRGQAPMGQGQAPMNRGQAPMGLGQAPMSQVSRGQAPMGLGRAPMNRGQAPMGLGQAPMSRAPMSRGQAPMSQGQALALSRFDRLLNTVRRQVPGITLRLFSSLSLVDLGLTGYAATNADSVGDALNIVSRYHELTSDRYRPVMESNGYLTRIVSIVEPGFGHEIEDIAEDHLAGTWNLLRQLLGEEADAELIKVRLAYSPPAYFPLYEQVFGTDVEFESETTELLFPSCWLKRPLALANPTLRELYATVCDRLLGSSHRQSDTKAAVRALLLSRQGRSIPGVEAAAQALNLSMEQLRKRLWRQGTSYKALVLECRMVLARNYLEATSFSIQEIAYLLDYSHPGAFTRAFKRYYEVSPQGFQEAVFKHQSFKQSD